MMIASLAFLLMIHVSAPPSDQADRVIQKAIAAMGGIERIHAIHSLVLRGFHYEGAYQQEFTGSRNSNATMIRMRPGLRLVGCRPEIPACGGEWSRIVEAFDGQRGWELNWPKQRLVRTVNKAEQALRCGAEFDYLFIDYKQRGFTASYLGRRSVLRKQVEAVKIDQAGCSSATYYFQPETYRLEMTQLTLPIHARGDAVETVSIHRDFKLVNGVRLASRSEEVNLKTGKVLGGGEWVSMEPNTLSDAAIFRPPDVHPKGITAVVLEMLQVADHATAAQMMAAYTAYRTTSEGKCADVTYDLNWLGYELLKVDKYEDALAVFQQIIAENPTSAVAYENLGEAYLQKHDRQNALAAFQKAVDLGSKSEDVRHKVAMLRDNAATI